MSDSTHISTRAFRAVGVGFHVMAAMPVLLAQGHIASAHLPFSSAPLPFAIWLIATLTEVTAFWFATASIDDERDHKRFWLLLVIQSVASLVSYWFVLDHTGRVYWFMTNLTRASALLIAAQVGLFVALRPALTYVIVHGIAWVAVPTIRTTDIAVGLWAYSAMMFPASVLIVITTKLMTRQARIGAELARTNVELRATQAIVAARERMEERLQISRELHDLLGHHLTALSLQLEAATHLTDGKPLEKIQHCQMLARLLLSDVRESVTSLRRDEKIDFTAALTTLVDATVHPIVHLSLDPQRGTVDAATARTIVRCVQEIITNASKHSRSENLWIEVSSADGQLRVHAHDDGVGTPKIRPGYGLQGMVERFERSGGHIEFASEPSGGFSLEAWIPLSGTAL